MSRKIAKILSTLILSTPLTSSVSLSSCSDNTFNMYISEAEKTKEGTDFSYTFKFSCSVKPEKGLRAAVVSDDSDVLSCTRDIDVVNKNDIKVTVNIAPYWNKSNIFNFGIKFVNNDTLEIVTITNLSIDFTYETPEYDIDVTLPEASIRQTMDYTFDFKFNFSDYPSGKTFNAQLIDAQHKSVTIPKPTCTVEADETGAFIGIVTVKLDVDTLKSTDCSFDLFLSFNNQRGIPLFKWFQACAIHFVFQEQEEMPVDYVSIKDNVVMGIDERVSPEEVKKYKYLEIDKGATEIAEGAFASGGEYDFSNFITIKLPKSLKTIPHNTFKSFSSLYYIDMTDYTEWPDWFKTTSREQSVFSDDPNHSFKYNGGIVWVNNNFVGKCDTRNQFVNPTFDTANWDVCSESEIIPNNLYKTETNPETGEVTLIGVDDSYSSQFYKYKIIKLPDNISVIKDSAFNDIFNGFPFVGDDSKTYNRRFIPNKNLKEMGNNLFSISSVGGFILFDCPNLKTIGKDTFCLSLYSEVNGEENISKPDIWEECGVFFRGCNNLTTLKYGCLRDTLDEDLQHRTNAGWLYKNNFTLVVPESVNSIGSTAFERTFLRHLTLKCPKVTFDNRALAYLSFLNDLDLSSISTDDLLNNWKTADGAEGVFYNFGAGFPEGVTVNVLLGKRSEEDAQKIIAKLTSNPWGLDPKRCYFAYS